MTASGSCAAPRVVLTHHWLVRRRGGEKVLEALAALFPDAPIFTLIHDPAQFPAAINRRVRTSLLQWAPGARRFYPQLLPLMPAVFRAMRLPPCDVVLCSDAALAKSIRPPAGARLICYCHSPMRYAWEPAISADYCRALPRALRPLWPRVAAGARRADRAAADRVHTFLANSATVAERIRRAYDRPARVVYPPVEVPAQAATAPRESFYLCVGHHVAYKRLPIAVEACRRLGRRLVVIGDGPDVRALLAARRRDPQAELHVTLLGWQPDAVVYDHYRRASALLFPGEEDFGIVPVEAQGHGCPVVAFGAGGATETVTDGVTGVLYSDPSAAGLAAAIERHERTRYDPAVLNTHARRFCAERFASEIMREVRESLALSPR